MKRKKTYLTIIWLLPWRYQPKCLWKVLFFPNFPDKTMEWQQLSSWLWEVWYNLQYNMSIVDILSHFITLRKDIYWYKIWIYIRIIVNICNKNIYFINLAHRRDKLSEIKYEYIEYNSFHYLKHSIYVPNLGLWQETFTYD